MHFRYLTSDSGHSETGTQYNKPHKNDYNSYSMGESALSDLYIQEHEGHGSRLVGLRAEVF